MQGRSSIAPRYVRFFWWDGAVLMDLSNLQLETPRLLLRLPRREDYEAWAAFGADEEATRYIGGVLARSPAWRNWRRRWAVGISRVSRCSR